MTTPHRCPDCRAAVRDVWRRIQPVLARRFGPPALRSRSTRIRIATMFRDTLAENGPPPCIRRLCEDGANLTAGV